MSIGRGNRGFALPLTIFLVALLSLLLTTAFSKVQVDRRLAESSGAMVTARSIAEGALQRYLADTATGVANPSSLCPPGRPRGRPVDGDSVRINVPGGYADVIARVLQKPADTLDPQMYIVRSTGHVIEPSQGADPQAVRTVAQFANWQTGAMNAVAAIVAGNGLVLDPSNGWAEGDDGYGSGNNTYGVRAPAGLFSGSPSNMNGAPAKTKVQDTPTQVLGEAGIDWAGIVAGQITPDHTTLLPNLYDYSTTMIQGDLVTPVQVTDGTGLLIVTGNLIVRGPLFIWHGIALIGGAIFDSTNGGGSSGAYFTGATVTGLNILLGATVPPNQIGISTSNRSRARYHTCYLRTSLAQMTGFAPVSNAWVDNWTTY